MGLDIPLPSASSPTELDRALGLAFRHLSGRERTVREVRRHLLEREIGPVAADAAIAALIDQGYLDDARFARLFTEDKRVLERWGAERIVKGLIARGIDGELARATVDDDPPGGELERARALLRRRFPDGVRDRRELERALGVLVRKGYAHELALQALRGAAGE